MFNQLLRCTHCHDDFEGLEEFSVCPNCEIGLLVSGSFAETGEGALDAAIFKAVESHPNCRCINDGNDYARQIEFSPLSFDDMEINEMCLIDLGLPLGHSSALEDPVPAITYYTDMNSRFLRTFLGEPVWA